MKEFSDVLDFSDYPVSHQLFSNRNKKISGKFKDVCSSQPMVEFIGLRPKMYSFTYIDKVTNQISEKKVAKGTKMSVKKRYLHHSYYKDALFSLSKYSAVMNTIRSDRHQLWSVNVKKSFALSICALDLQ